MRSFAYIRATDVSTAVHAITEHPNAKFLGGGTNLVDLMREDIEHPDTVIDVTRLPLTEIEVRPDGGLRVGALVRNGRLADHPVVRSAYPVLAQALLMGASGQLRNMATVGGNILQRTRCLSFYDDAAPCNKRSPGSGCDAIGGFNRMSAILGASEHCIATHPSDMCVALTALDAIVEVESVRGTRRIPLAELHRLPGTTPHIETALEADELITAVEVPALSFSQTSRYRKVRDRASYAFALVSVAAALDVQDGIVTGARLALGGVAHKPWRASGAEQLLVGRPATEESFRAAAAAELAPAIAQSGNGFKIELTQRVIVSTLMTLTTDGGAA